MNPITLFFLCAGIVYGYRAGKQADYWTTFKAYLKPGLIIAGVVILIATVLAVLLNFWGMLTVVAIFSGVMIVSLIVSTAVWAATFSAAAWIGSLVTGRKDIELGIGVAAVLLYVLGADLVVILAFILGLLAFNWVYGQKNTELDNYVSKVWKFNFVAVAVVYAVILVGVLAIDGIAPTIFTPGAVML